MKKKSGSRIVRVLTKIINIRVWCDWDRMKAFTLYLAGGIKGLFIPQKIQDGESFNAAMAELKLSNEDLLIKQKALLRLSILMSAIAVMMLFYMGYQLFYGSFRAAVVSVVVMCIALVLAFRYHFWQFQIKKRKLGCTIHEWYKQGLLGEKE